MPDFDPLNPFGVTEIKVLSSKTIKRKDHLGNVVYSRTYPKETSRWKCQVCDKIANSKSAIEFHSLKVHPDMSKLKITKVEDQTKPKEPEKQKEVKTQEEPVYKKAKPKKEEPGFFDWLMEDDEEDEEEDE